MYYKVSILKIYIHFNQTVLKYKVIYFKMTSYSTFVSIEKTKINLIMVRLFQTDVFANSAIYFICKKHRIFSWKELNFMLLQFYTYLTESGNSSCNCSSLLFTILGLGKKFFAGSKLQVVIHTLTKPSV